MRRPPTPLLGKPDHRISEVSHGVVPPARFERDRRGRVATPRAVAGFVCVVRLVCVMHLVSVCHGPVVE